jgi:hypothetical protein
MAQPYTVTGGTSIVLISTLESPNTVVLLSSIQYPGHIVGIRDITGSNSIAQTPIVISTMSSLTFYDGTSSILLNTPNGFVSVSSRDRRTWQLLNSFGFLTTLSTGFLETLTSERAFVRETSTIQEFASTLEAKNVVVAKSIEVLGNTQIEGDIQIAGSFNVFSTLRAYQDVRLSSSLEVAGNVSFPSSLFVQDNLLVGSNLSTSQNLLVGNDLLINDSLYTRGTLLPPYLSVQTLTLETLTVGGGLQLGGGFSSLNMSVASNVVVAGKGMFETSLFVSGMTSVQSTFSFDSQLTTSSFEVINSVFFGDTIRVSTLTVSGGLSTLESLSLSNQGTFQGNSFVYGPMYVKSTTIVDNITVASNVYMSSLIVSTFGVGGFVSSYGSTFLVERNLEGLSTFAIGGDLIAGGRGEPYTYSFFSTGFDVSTLVVHENLTIQKRFNVTETSLIGGNLNGITSLTSLGNISTGDLNVGGSITFLGNLDVNQVASASTLGAPIRFDISTLVLSNTLTVNSFASIPSFAVNEVPAKLAAGSNFVGRGGYDIYVDGALLNRSTIAQTPFGSSAKRWYANTLETSSLSGLPNLSSVVLGNTNFAYPIGDPYQGVLTGGQSLTGTNISFASNVSSVYFPCQGAPTGLLSGFIPRRIRYNGFLWVAVGQGGSGTAYSLNGFTWFPGSGVTLSLGYDITFAQGKWVAVGLNPAGASIIYSLNGIVWSAALNFFTSPGYGRGVAYNGVNQWVAVGANQFNQKQAKYSSDGITWINANIAGGNVDPLKCVIWALNRWVTWQHGGFGNFQFESSDGITFNATSSKAAVFQNTEYAAYYNGVYLMVGSSGQGSPVDTISYNYEGGSLQGATAGVFTAAATDVVFDSNTNYWYVSGYNIGGIGQTVAISPFIDPPLFPGAMTFTLTDGISGSNNTIAVGTLQTPLFAPYFTANMTSIFHSTLSSQQMTVSTLNVSSIQGAFFGDGSRLTNITQYSSSLFVSSITAEQIFAHDVSSSVVRFQQTNINDSIQVPLNQFPSTGNLFLAAGNDNLARGSILNSTDGSAWQRSLTSNFEFYGNGIAGNGNLESPFYVAVGADSRTNHTIQWSEDGIVWNPIQTGGFNYATAEGIHEGTSVAYNPITNSWAALGVYQGSTATIQYSYDGVNWSYAGGGFDDFGTKVKYGFGKFVAIGPNVTKLSVDGSFWQNYFLTDFTSPGFPLISTTFTALGAGIISAFGSFSGWVAVDTQNRVFLNEDSFFFFNANFYWYGDYTVPMPVNDLIWRGNTNWTAIGSNVIQTSPSGRTSWSIATFLGDTLDLNAIIYNSTLMTYVLGATSLIPEHTLWTSSDGTFTWQAANSGSGFSTAVETFGQGYGVVSLGTSTFAVGNSALSDATPVRPAILKLFSTANETLVTEISLTASNASNLFTNVVRGIGATELEAFKFVAVGESPIPQKTIARSVDGSPGSWIPAITGGFSPAGYGVTYYQDRWIAVGDAQSSRNTIQYSPDGANWFGTNTTNALRLGGRGVAVGLDTLSNVVVAVGRDTASNTIAVSADGFNWSTITSCNFNVQGNGVAGGLYSNFMGVSPLFVAVGQDTRGFTRRILQSSNGSQWVETSNNNYFTNGGYGVAYGNYRWVAVGEDSNLNTIVYSDDGTFWNAASGGFTFAGYGVTYSEGFSSFFAVGRDINGDAPFTVKYSENGESWTNFSTGSGFISQKNIGSANGLMTQGIFTFESFPYISFCNLVVYDRPSPLLYPIPGIRASETYIGFSEGIFVNHSNQVAFGSNSNYPGAAVTVSPNTTYVSSILYTGPLFISSLAYFSSVTASSIQANSLTHLYNPLEMPSLAVNPPSTLGAIPASPFIPPPRFEMERPTFITPEIGFDSNLTLYVNKALRVNALKESVFSQDIAQNNVIIGKELSDSNYSIFNSPEAFVYGDFAASTVSTNFVYAPCNVYISASRVYYRDDYLSMFEGLNPSLVLTGNRIQTEPSSMTFNSLLTLQVSTQKVGVYTRDPQFDLDVQRDAILGGIQAKEINTSLLFLTLQTFNN